MSFKYNIYDKRWVYIGCFWAATPYFQHKEVGDYLATKYDGPILSKDLLEFNQIRPIDCYLKLMEEKCEKTNK